MSLQAKLFIVDGASQSQDDGVFDDSLQQSFSFPCVDYATITPYLGEGRRGPLHPKWPACEAVVGHRGRCHPGPEQEGGPEHLPA